MKLRPPAFWQNPTPTLSARLLLPFSWITGYLTRQRQKRPSLKLPVPVLCCGNISVGGTGKTPLALDIIARLTRCGHHPHAITRGYGGRSSRNGLIEPERDKAVAMGDEAMLLAALAPTWRGPDRKTNALKAIDAGADCLILDDGLQDPALHKDITILTVDGPVGLGNQHLLPAGPLRESLANALPRLDAAVIFGEDTHHIAAKLPPALPILRGRMTPGETVKTLRGQAVIAFTGIGRPEKFFTTLRKAGLDLHQTFSFPDHHIYTPGELAHLAHLAHESGMPLLTTEKDSVKLPQPFRQSVRTIPVTPQWDDPAHMDALLDQLFIRWANRA